MDYLCRSRDISLVDDQSIDSESASHNNNWIVDTCSFCIFYPFTTSLLCAGHTCRYMYHSTAAFHNNHPRPSGVVIGLSQKSVLDLYRRPGIATCTQRAVCWGRSGDPVERVSGGCFFWLLDPTLSLSSPTSHQPSVIAFPNSTASKQSSSPE